MTEPSDLPVDLGPVRTTEPGAIVFLPLPEEGFTAEEIYEQFSSTPHGDVLVAAADVHDGAMIALVPSDDDLARLAVGGGEPLDQLHLTLLYLGDAVNINDQDRQDILDSMEELAARLPVVIGDAFAVSVFNPTGPEPCVVLILAGMDLVDAHESVIENVNDVDLPTLPEQHVPWIPHVTLLYVDPMEGIDNLEVTEFAGQRSGEVTFDRLRVAFGGEITDFNLAEASTAAGGIVFHLSGKHNQKTHGGGGGPATVAPASEVAHNKGVFDQGGAEGPAAWGAVEFGLHKPNRYDSPTGVTQGELGGQPKAKLQTAVAHYTGNASDADYATSLRTGEKSKGFKTKEAMDENTHLIDHAIEHSPLQQATIVHRGVADPHKTFGDSWSDSDATGLTFRDKSFSSTSTDIGVAHYHSDRAATAAKQSTGTRPQEVIITTRVPAGVGAIQGAYREQELLLPRNTTYQIVADHGVDSDGVRRLDAVVIP